MWTCNTFQVFDDNEQSEAYLRTGVSSSEFVMSEQPSSGNTHLILEVLFVRPVKQIMWISDFLLRK